MRNSLLAALSLGVDLGVGQPMEHVLRQCVISLRLAERLGLDDRDRVVVYYSALLVDVGCHSDAHEQAKWFGDDIALKSTKYTYDMRSLRGAAASMRLIGSENSPLHRFLVGLEFAIRGHRDMEAMIHTHSEIPLAARITVAEYIEVAHRVGGVGAAVVLARKRSGSQFDPDLAAFLCTHADELLSDLDATRTWQAVIEAEPVLGVRLVGDDIDAALRAIADFVDLKSPYTLGHARAVAELAAGAATRLGLPAAR